MTGKATDSTTCEFCADSGAGISVEVIHERDGLSFDCQWKPDFVIVETPGDVCFRVDGLPGDDSFGDEDFSLVVVNFVRPMVFPMIGNSIIMDKTTSKFTLFFNC